MNGRLASRAAEAEALLARFNEVSEAALHALERRDTGALQQALDLRDALRHEIDRLAREIAVTRSRFAPNDAPAVGGNRIVDRAVSQYVAPLEALTRVAQELQQRLEDSAREIRDGLLGQIAALDNANAVATRYATTAVGDPHRFDVRL
jgi:hypothetical protein